MRMRTKTINSKGRDKSQDDNDEDDVQVNNNVMTGVQQALEGGEAGGAEHEGNSLADVEDCVYAFLQAEVDAMVATNEAAQPERQNNSSTETVVLHASLVLLSLQNVGSTVVCDFLTADLFPFCARVVIRT